MVELWSTELQSSALMTFAAFNLFEGISSHVGLRTGDASAEVDG